MLRGFKTFFAQFFGSVLIWGLILVRVSYTFVFCPFDFGHPHQSECGWFIGITERSLHNFRTKYVLIFHPAVKHDGILQFLDSLNPVAQILIDINDLRNFYRIGRPKQMVKSAHAILSFDSSTRKTCNLATRKTCNSLTQTRIGNFASENMRRSPAHISELQFVPHMDSVEYLFNTQRHPTVPCWSTPIAKFDANRNEFGYHPSAFAVHESVSLALQNRHLS